jgi:hypothetical protein
MAHQTPPTPQWWRVILRFRLHRYERRMWRDGNELHPDARATPEVMRRRIAHRLFFGKDGQL